MNEPQISSTARFLLTLLLVVLGSLLILCLTTFASVMYLDSVSPGWSEQPLSLLPPLGYAMLVTPLIEIIILSVLAWRRVRFAEFFLVLICFGYVLVVVPTMVVQPLAEKYSHHWYPVWLGTPSDYPVLVLTPGQQAGSFNAQVVRWSDLSDFRKRNPECSFVVPKGQRYDDLRAQLPSSKPQWLLAHPGLRPSQTAYFWSSDISDKRQRFYVSLTPPLIESWYEAEPTQIYPKYVRTTQTYFGYRIASWILVLALDLGALAIYLSRRRKKRNSRVVSA